MPRTCTICNHPDYEAINVALITGEPFRNIARRFGTSSAALFRHKTTDLPAALVKAAEIAQAAQADTLVGRLASLNTETMAILREARLTKDNELSLKAIARAEKQLELEGRLLGELADQKPKCQILIYAPPLEDEGSFKVIEV